MTSPERPDDAPRPNAAPPPPGPAAPGGPAPGEPQFHAPHPHEPHPHAPHPHAPHPHAPHPHAPQPVREPRSWRRELLAALAVALGVAATGAPFGLLWRAVTPKVNVQMAADGPRLVDAEPEGYVAGDGSFVLLGLGFGVLLAAAVWLLVRRHRGPVVLLALVLGGVACGVLASWLGNVIGLDEYRRLLDQAEVGRRFQRPVAVQAKEVGLWFGVVPRVQGAVLVPALAAAALYTLLAAFHRASDLRDDGPEEEYAEEGSGDGGEQQPVSSGWSGSPAPVAAPAPPVPGPAAPPPG